MEKLGRYTSPLGEIVLASEGDRLTGLWFKGQKYEELYLSGEHMEEESPAILRARDWLDVYFSGRDPGFTPPLYLRGTAFQERVWQLLMAIPYGTTVTYGELAARLSRGRMSAQAVGGAVGRNRISLIVPCHRVLGSHGSLTGYAGGLDRKLSLLALEGVDTSGLSYPK